MLLDSKFLHFFSAACFAAFPLGNCPVIILPWSFPNAIARAPEQGTLRHTEPGSERELTHTDNRPSVSLQSLGQTILLFRRYRIDWPPGAHSDGHFNNASLDGLHLLLWFILAFPLLLFPRITSQMNCLLQAFDLGSDLRETQVETGLHAEIPTLPSGHPSQGKILQLFLWYWSALHYSKKCPCFTYISWNPFLFFTSLIYSFISCEPILCHLTRQGKFCIYANISILLMINVAVALDGKRFWNTDSIIRWLLENWHYGWLHSNLAVIRGVSASAQSWHDEVLKSSTSLSGNLRWIFCVISYLLY